MANTFEIILIQSIQMETLSSKLIKVSNLILRSTQPNNTLVHKIPPKDFLSLLYSSLFLSCLRSLINVNEWNEKLLKSLPKNQRHDIAIWLTRLNIGGPSGYAPVDGICDPARSCSLNRNVYAVIGTN